jgi:hypothetical protein
MNTDQPSVFIAGLRIDEPVTTLADLAISLVCFYAFFRLRTMVRKQPPDQYLWFYFLGMGIAAAMGGIIGHGLMYRFPEEWKLPGWLISMVSISLIGRAMIERVRNIVSKRLRKTLATSDMLLLLTLMTLTVLTLDFFYAGLYILCGLLGVTGSLNACMYARNRDPGSRQFLYAVGISVLGSLIFLIGWNPHPWFNHFDACHTLLVAASVFLFRGSRIIFLKQDLARNS